MSGLPVLALISSLVALQLERGAPLVVPPVGMSVSIAEAAHRSTPIVIPAGTRLSVRLLSPLAGAGAKPGGRVRAVVIVPITLEGRVAIANGDTVAGSVVDAGVRTERGRRHYLTLTFDQIRAAGDGWEPIAAKVVDVPNARDTVDSDGRILGPAVPGVLHSRAVWGAVLLGTVDPVAAAIFFAAVRGEELERHRAVQYAAGVELTVELTSAHDIAQWPSAPSVGAVADTLLDMLRDAPLRATFARSNLSADVVTLAIVGSQDEVETAFRLAGWTKPANSLGASLHTLMNAARARGFAEQPVSTLELDGHPPALAYQKVVNTMARRHHLRMWKWRDVANMRAVWLVAATRDDGIYFSPKRRSFTHHVDPSVDVERQKILDDLLAANVVHGWSRLPRQVLGAPGFLNDGKTPIVTDWQLAVVELAATR